MRRIQILKRAGASAITAALLIAAAVVSSRMAHAGDDRQSTEAKIRTGFAIAPVPLNLSGKNVELVGLGSYLVNAQASCNDCHSAGPQTQYAPGGNPFFGQKPAKQNAATYLGGGRSFGSLLPTGTKSLGLSCKRRKDSSTTADGRRSSAGSKCCPR